MVQSVAAVKRFRREWVAVNALHTIVLGVAKHQTVPWFFSNNVNNEEIKSNNEEINEKLIDD